MTSNGNTEFARGGQRSLFGRGALTLPAWRGAAWAVALIAVLLTGTLWGVQMVPMSLEELTARADLVLYGKVLSKTCLRDGAGRICSKVELEVREAWKGAAASGRFTITLGGGTLGDRRIVVPGQADYTPGEEVVVFLRVNQRGEGVTLGLAQGKLDVRVEAGTGARVLRGPFLGGSPPPPEAPPVCSLRARALGGFSFRMRSAACGEGRRDDSGDGAIRQPGGSREPARVCHRLGQR